MRKEKAYDLDRVHGKGLLRGKCRELWSLVRSVTGQAHAEEWRVDSSQLCRDLRLEDYVHLHKFVLGYVPCNRKRRSGVRTSGQCADTGDRPAGWRGGGAGTGA